MLAVTDLIVRELAPYALLLLAIGLALWQGRALAGTTLTGPRNWLVVAFVLNLLAEKVIIANPDAGQGLVAAVRFAAATALFCPTVSVLGAKRPQDRAWHAIVFSLWVVLTLPAAEGYFVRHSAALEVHDARGWFLWMLIAVGLFNYLPTRHWSAAVCFAVAQATLLASHLPLWRADVGAGGRTLAFGLLAAAVTLVVLQGGRPRDKRDGLTRVWCDFRDAYGAVWALRVMERLNQTSRVSKWPIAFGWDGIATDPDASQPVDEEAVTRALRTVLRRFVSEQWIERRIQ